MSRNGILKIHLDESKEAALRLFNATTSVVTDSWKEEYSLILTKELLTFGFHARAAIEMAGLKNSHLTESIDLYPVKFSIKPEGESVIYLSEALNYILHARDFSFGWTHSDHRIQFEKNQNLIPTYIYLSTDRRKSKIISIYGMTYVYLNTVFSKIK